MIMSIRHCLADEAGRRLSSSRRSTGLEGAPWGGIWTGRLVRRVSPVLPTSMASPGFASVQGAPSGGQHEGSAQADGVRRELAAEDRTRRVLGFDGFDTLVALLESARDALLKNVAADWQEAGRTVSVIAPTGPRPWPARPRNPGRWPESPVNAKPDGDTRLRSPSGYSLADSGR
jgi:hypothetical protein